MQGLEPLSRSVQLHVLPNASHVLKESTDSLVTMACMVSDIMFHCVTVLCKI